MAVKRNKERTISDHAAAVESGVKDPIHSRDATQAGRAEKPPFSRAKNGKLTGGRAEEEVEDESEISSESDGDFRPYLKPYQVLLQSLQATVPKENHRRKKRKLTHSDQIINGNPKQRTFEAVSAEEPQEVIQSEDSNGSPPPEDDQSDDAASNGSSDNPEDDESAAMDPFERHFTHSNGLQAITSSSWANKTIPFHPLGMCLRSRPGSKDEIPEHHSLTSSKSLILKKRLKAKILFDHVQQAVAQPLFEYTDVLFAGRTIQNAASLRQLYCLHALNHVFKTRDRVIKNNARLAREPDNPDLELRDQGFTRPKVLILLDTRQACARAAEVMAELCQPQQQENKQRFMDSFSAPLGKFAEDRPEDFRDLFDGNDDDDFRVGVKFTRKTMKYLSTFYNSDIIFASPLGLRRAIDAGSPKKQDFDYLSSIELLIVDQASAMLMQNWSHITHIMPHLNCQPTSVHNTDFSRVRHFYLDGHSAHLRQTVVLSAYLTPELKQLASQHMRNVAGRIIYSPNYTDSTLQSVTRRGIRQTFSRFHSPMPAADSDSRFAYFTAAILPSLIQPQVSGANSSEGGMLIFVHSYASLLRLKQLLKNLPASTPISCSVVSEYSTASEVARARTLFAEGRSKVLLYSQRAHHFRRYRRIRGVKRVIFLGLPDNPLFYTEVVAGYLGEELMEGKIEKGHVKVVFSKWDTLKLERVVGSDRVGTMLKERAGDTFDFM